MSRFAESTIPVALMVNSCRCLKPEAAARELPPPFRRSSTAAPDTQLLGYEVRLQRMTPRLAECFEQLASRIRLACSHATDGAKRAADSRAPEKVRSLATSGAGKHTARGCDSRGLPRTQNRIRPSCAQVASRRASAKPNRLADHPELAGSVLRGLRTCRSKTPIANHPRPRASLPRRAGSGESRSNLTSLRRDTDIASERCPQCDVS